MNACKRRNVTLLIAGGVMIAGVLLAAVAYASGQIPKPSMKPMLGTTTVALVSSAGIPIPARKPMAQKAGKPIHLAMAQAIENIPSKSIHIFSDKQARLYREIFDLQRQGQVKAADQKIKRLSNSILIGHILADRYLNPNYDTSYKALARWLDKYPDHPQAEKIYGLAIQKSGLTYKGELQRPTLKKSKTGNIVSRAQRGKTYKSQKNRSSSEQARVQKLRRNISQHVARGEPSLALNLLSNDYALQFMDHVEHDRLKAKIASGYFYSSKNDKALKLAQEIQNRSGHYAPVAGWIAGLIHWQNQDYKKSAMAFEGTASSSYASGWMISAAAYWASRANMRAGNKKLVSKWLALAATYPRTFYGLIAAHASGQKGDFNWSIPSLSRDDIRFIEGTQNGKRAAALIKVGRTDLAAAELRMINVERSVTKQSALMAYAHYYDLSSLLMDLGNTYSHPKGGFYDSALYPVSNWQPLSGYQVDKALIHAIIRQESRFYVTAANASGATGLMQLMPRTANYVAGKDLYTTAQGRYQLSDPKVNLELGQKYIRELLNHRVVGQDLFSLAMAYNAGPGTLSRWKAERSYIKDPLFFIETIPYDETRAFVERVMSNYWMYRIRLKQSTPSLDAVAKGQWARYAAQDNGVEKLAAIQ